MKDVPALIEQQIRDHIEVNQRLIESEIDTLFSISQQMISTIRSGGTIYLFGNGGSAADSQHIATEFVCRFLRDRQPLPAISFTSNMAVLTAVANDYDYSQVFVRQVNAHVTGKDICVGISTSGKSSNVLEGMKAARQIGAKTVGFTGENGQQLSELSDICFMVPAKNSARIQEAHLLAWHIVLDIIELDFIERPK